MTTAAVATPDATPATPPAEPTPAGATPDPATPAVPTPAAPVAAAVTPEPIATPAPPEGQEPHVPEPYALTLPETTTLTPEMLPLIEAEARAMGLSPAQAQSLVNARSEAVAAQSAAYLTDAKADPEIGGAKWDTTVAHALKGLDFLFPKDSEEGAVVRQWFDATGLGNHKTFLRAMARIGKTKTEDVPASPGALGSKGAVSPEEKLYGPSST